MSKDTENLPAACSKGAQDIIANFDLEELVAYIRDTGRTPEREKGMIDASQFAMIEDIPGAHADTYLRRMVAHGQLESGLRYDPERHRVMRVYWKPGQFDTR